MDEHTISPAGDPFHAAAQHHERGCFTCYDGVVYIGHLEVDHETGDEYEVVTAYPCRCCNA